VGSFADSRSCSRQSAVRSRSALGPMWKEPKFGVSNVQFLRREICFVKLMPPPSPQIRELTSKFQATCTRERDNSYVVF
jgi:hypothetical protein